MSSEKMPAITENNFDAPPSSINIDIPSLTPIVSDICGTITKCVRSNNETKVALARIDAQLDIAMAQIEASLQMEIKKIEKKHETNMAILNILNQNVQNYLDKENIPIEFKTEILKLFMNKMMSKFSSI